MTSYLPQHEGLLPLWLLVVSAASGGNTIQAFLSLKFTKRVYPGSVPSSKTSSSKHGASAARAAPISPVTPLQARTFAVWTLLSAIVRAYGAYHISNPQVYEIALCTYVLAWGHFMSEWLYYGTTSWGAGLVAPVLVSNGSLVWMLAQWGYYVH